MYGLQVGSLKKCVCTVLCLTHLHESVYVQEDWKWRVCEGVGVRAGHVCVCVPQIKTFSSDTIQKQAGLAPPRHYLLSAYNLELRLINWHKEPLPAHPLKVMDWHAILGGNSNRVTSTKQQNNFIFFFFFFFAATWQQRGNFSAGARIVK